MPAMVAAVRETIEETAVPVGLAPPPTADMALELQQALVAEQAFAGLLAERALALDCDER